MDTVTARALEFNEAEHPRGRGDEGGQFIEKGTGGASGSAPTRQPYQPPQSRPGRFNRSGSRSGPSPAAPRTKYVNTLKAGQDNDPAAVQQLQAMLGELGLGQIAVDGLFGPQTEAAVKAAQTKLGLKPTGTASGALMNRLHDAHTLSPCIDRAQSKVTASVGGGPVIASGDDGAAEHTGAMVALIPADEDAERLGVDDGEPLDELHCTLLFLGEAEDLDNDTREKITAAVADVAAQHGPVEADGFAVSMFNPNGDDPCIVLGLSGVELAAAHDAVEAEVEASPEQHQPWIPHVTLVYDADPSAVADLVDRTGPVVFDRIRVAFGDEVHDYPLRGAPVTAALGHDIHPGGERLHRYWTKGPGLARWAESPTPWTTLVANLREEVEGHTLEELKRWASAWFLEVFHFAAGSDLNRVTHGHPPRGKLVGPG